MEPPEPIPSRDQHFMVDERILSSIIEHAGLTGKDTVLEIGGGTGNLTRRILEAGCRLIVVEKDGRLAEYLEKMYGRQTRVIRGDAVKALLPGFNKVVSNIPYSISRKITERLLLEGFERAVLVFQREYARKLMAGPGDDNYRPISVIAQTVADVRIIMDIHPASFEPAPNVWSSMVEITPRFRPEKEYLDFVKKLFSQRRKKIGNIIEDAGKYSEYRPYELTPGQVRTLYTD